MRANVKPTDAPNAKELVPTKMDNQHNKLDRNTPVCTHEGRNAVPYIWPRTRGPLRQLRY